MSGIIDPSQHGEVEVDGGGLKKPPVTLKVSYDPDSQAVAVNFEPSEFKTWDLIIGVLEVAQLQAKDMRQAAQAAAMQQHMHSQAMAQQIMGRRGNGSR